MRSYSTRFSIFLKLFRESFLFAFEALRVNKLRTMLSLLGITIGIFTIISVLTVVDSLESNIRGSVNKLGSNVLYVQKWPWAFSDDYPWWKYFQRPNPQLQEEQELKRRLQSADAVSFVIGLNNRTVKYRSNSIEGITITAHSHDYELLRTFNFLDGRYFTANESRSGKNMVVIGSAVADGLFGNANPIGQQITALGRKLTVIGVLNKEGEDLLGTSADKSVFIPINYVRNVLDIRSDRYGPSLMIQAKSGIDIKEMENEVQGAMRSIRKLSPTQEDNFALNKSSLLANQMEALFGIINLVGWIIGGFSILVGGFGIANIMFVSVRERTNIIGIQKSLGAKNYFILLQFLVESIVLCLIGGAIGLFIVFLGTSLISATLDFDILLTLKNIIVGLTVSVIIGMISGFWPAYSASQLDPVEAIRSK